MISEFCRRLSAVFVIGTVLMGCVGPAQKAEQYATQDEWLKAVVEYRKAYSSDPRNVEYRSRLKQMELKAADYYYQQGMSLLEQGAIDAAIVQFQQGLASMPDHSKLQQAIANAMARKEASASYQEGLRDREAGKNKDARRAFQKALQIYPDYKQAQDALKQLQKRIDALEDPNQFALTSRAPITLNFRQTDLKTAFEFIAKSFGVTVIFDEGIKSVPVTLFAQDVTFEQALNLLFATHKIFYKKIGPNTLLIIPDTKEKRGQYEDYLIRTFQLNTIKAKEMADILKGLLTVKKIIVNEELNTLIVRDTDDTMQLVERLIEANDRKPAEMILEVEILEVNRSKAEKLGLEIGSSISAFMPDPGTVAAGHSILNALRDSAVLTLPSATFRFFKQDVDAKTLANPKIRVMNGKLAKIHVGDRIPFRTVIRDSLQQERSSYDYKDVGIKLTAEPIIHIDNSATVKLTLEVSSLGENLGTTTEPAYRIGTRNAETYMLLRDGETAILGGLIRDEDRNTRVKIPLLGDIPVIGSLFTSYDNGSGRTDVLLTITPRIVRGWDTTPADARQFYSGTAETYSTQPLFTDMKAPTRTKSAATPAVATQPQLTVTPQPGSTPAETAQQVPKPVESSTNGPAIPSAAVPSVATTPGTAVAPPSGPPPAEATVAPPIFSFGSGTYEANADQQFEIALVGENLGTAKSVSLEILFNPQLVGFVKGEVASAVAQNFHAEVDEGRGAMKITMDFASDVPPAGAVTLGKLYLQAARVGTSYLVYRTPTLKGANGDVANSQVRGARVHIK